MKTIIFLLITLLDILLISTGYRNNNTTFKIIGYILLLPILFTIGSLVYQVFIA